MARQALTVLTRPKPDGDLPCRMLKPLRATVLGLGTWEGWEMSVEFYTLIMSVRGVMTSTSLQGGMAGMYIRGCPN